MTTSKQPRCPSRLITIAAMALVPLITGCIPLAGAAIWTPLFAGELLYTPLRSLLGTIYLEILNNTILIPAS